LRRKRESKTYHATGTLLSETRGAGGGGGDVEKVGWFSKSLSGGNHEGTVVRDANHKDRFLGPAKEEKLGTAYEKKNITGKKAWFTG